MPLRALVDGRGVQVWDLTREGWADLRRRGRAETAPVLMACCGRPGLAKTSRNGNPFFAHPLMLRRTMIFGDTDLEGFKARLQTSRSVGAP